MKIIDYITKKNSIIEKYCGVTLIPANQMVDIPEKKKLFMDADKYACPYCVAYSANQCKGCPMFEAGNDCHLPTSTYNQMCLAIDDLDMTHSNAPWYEELCDLVNEFNQQFKK
jgi:hypothetical protein